MISVSALVRTLMQWLTLCLGIASLFIAFHAFVRYEDMGDLQGRLAPVHMQREISWKTFDPIDLENGVSIPPHTNVIIHLPATTDPLTRKILFGQRGKRVRYWGYCFTSDEERAKRLRRGAFPGTVFLSEKEREVRMQRHQQTMREEFFIPDHLDEDYLNQTKVIRGRIRHQQEIFQPGTSCYVMAEEPLPAGIDTDGDGLNSSLEKDSGTDATKPDTDGDGINDGLEVLRLGSNPRLRDSDGDGLIDSMEDVNKNGRVDIGETNPTEWDTDHDGLCDGLCVIISGGRTGYSAPKGYTPDFTAQDLRGEDKNLNGKVDSGEYDPRNWDTDGDGISDEHEYFSCKLAGRDDC